MNHQIASMKNYFHGEQSTVNPNTISISTDDPYFLNLFTNSLRDRDVSIRTISAYKSDVFKFIQYLGASRQGEGVALPHQSSPNAGQASEVALLNLLQPHQLEHYLGSLSRVGIKFSTIKRSLAGLKEYFTVLLENHLIQHDPTLNIKITRLHLDVLSISQIISVFKYVLECRISPISIRQLRDELILHLMLLHGIRQYQLPNLKLSAMIQEGGSFKLSLSQYHSIQLHHVTLLKLREFLSARKSAEDVIFFDHLSEKPIPILAIQILLQDLSSALNIHCTPVSFHHTYLHLANNPDDLKQLLAQLNQLNVGSTKSIS